MEVALALDVESDTDDCQVNWSSLTGTVPLCQKPRACLQLGGVCVTLSGRWRAPMTTSSEMEVALRSSRTRTTVPSRMSCRSAHRPASGRSRRPSRSSPCARPDSPCPCQRRRRTRHRAHGARGACWCRRGRCWRSARRQPACGAGKLAALGSSTRSSCRRGVEPGARHLDLHAEGTQQ